MPGIDIHRIRKNGVLQQDSSDCGVACLATFIRYFGGECSIDQLRKESGTDQGGTTMLGLLQAARKMGFDATGYEADVDEIIRYGRVLILHVTLNDRYDHYIACFGYEGEKFIFWDPAKGLLFLCREELSEIWISRKCLGLLPGNGFERNERQKDLIRDWLKEKIRPDLNILMVSLITGIAISALGMVMAVFTQKLIDDILPSKQYRLLAISLVLLLLLLTIRSLLGYVRQSMLLNQGRNFNIRVIDDFFGLLFNLPRPFFDTRKKGDFIGRLNDTMRIQRVISEFVSTYLIDILVIIFSLAFLFYYSVISAIITLVFIPSVTILIYRWNKKILDSQREAMASYANTESSYIDTLGGITEIKTLQWNDHFRQKNISVFTEFQTRMVMLGKIKIDMGMIAGMAGIAYLIVVLAITSVMVFRSVITSGELLAVLSICSGILPSVLNLSLLAIPLSEVKVTISRMFEFTRSKPETWRSGADPQTLQFESIRLADIFFRFPGRSLLLKGINMSLKRGQIVSLTGESGIGKSTIAGILMRFYEAESGRILVDGYADASAVSIGKWRQKVIVIPQEIHIFNGTILQNLLTEASEENLKALALMISDFGLVRFFDSFPAGLLTRVGEDGLNLSGGQRQIIAFVRALARKPDFLIIDEGTSNLDRNSEGIILGILQKIKSTTGILMISHKSDLVRRVSDEVYILEEGILSCLSVKVNTRSEKLN